MKQVNILLKSNGEVKRIITDKKMSVNEYTDILNCDYIDIKGLKLDELNISLVFDDEFLFTDKAINKKLQYYLDINSMKKFYVEMY